MFTGIVSAIGKVVGEGPKKGHLAIECFALAPKLAMGGSISVNGVCLTVVELGRDFFRADVVPETFARTNLGDLHPGHEVNLETPLTLASPLDGHLVQGHVDATARVSEVTDVAQGKEVSIELPKQLSRYVAEKGSIAVDGVSLTVKELDSTSFKVALIPHTLEQTVAKHYAPGHKVNLEVDLLARYLERLAGI